MKGHGSGRTVFEIGSVCKRHCDMGHKTVFNRIVRPKELDAVVRSMDLHDEWCAKARQAIGCWILVARQKNVVRDIRNVISKMVWADRAAWSERQCQKPTSCALL